MNENKVKKNCKFYNKPEICQEIREDGNCYQCIIANYEIVQKENIRLCSKVTELEIENKKLRTEISREGLQKVESKIKTELVDYDYAPIKHRGRKNKTNR